MDFIVDQILGEARRRGVEFAVSPDGALQPSGDADALDSRFTGLLSRYADRIVAHLAPDPPRSWLKPLTPTGGGVVVYLLPAAGAGPTTYRAWSAGAALGLEVQGVLLPGREERFSEEPVRDAGTIAARVAEEIRGRADGRPFVLFGHSTGGLVAAEVAQRLGAAHRPAALVVAASVAPDDVVAPDPRPTDDDLALSIESWAGTPESVRNDPGFRDAFLPALRADLDVWESGYRPRTATSALSLPLVCLHGTDDEGATRDVCAGWARWTTARYSELAIPGGHFFPVTAATEVLQVAAAAART